MAFFDFFRSFSFFKGKDVTDLHEEDLDFQKWIAAHRNWRQRLTSYVDGSSQEVLDENVICVDNRCDLGKWIHGHGGKFYGDVSTFQKMMKDHAQFHATAGQVVRFYKSQDVRSARNMLNGDFDLYSLRVIQGLESLEKQIKQ